MPIRVTLRQKKVLRRSGAAASPPHQSAQFPPLLEGEGAGGEVKRACPVLKVTPIGLCPSKVSSG